MPPRCSLLDERELVLGRRLGEEAVEPGLLGDRGRGERVVAGDHHRADPEAAQLVEALAQPGLHDVLQMDDAEDPRSFSATTSGVPPDREIDSTNSVSSGGTVSAALGDVVTHAVGGTLADRVLLAAPHAVRRSAAESMPDIRVCALKGTSTASTGSTAITPYVSSHSRTIDRPSGVSSARLERSAALARRFSETPCTGSGRGRFPVADRDRAGLVEQQGRDVTRGLDRPARHGQHVVLHQPVHAGDADRRQQTADRRRDEAHEQRDEHDDVLLGVRVHRERLEARDREEEDDREPGEQDRQRDLVRRLLAVRALDERDHPVEERLARLRRDPHDDLVRQHAGAAGHRRPVAARLAHDGRRLAGDRRLVDRRDALDHVAVGGDHLAGRDDAFVADVELGWTGRARPFRRLVRRFAIVSVRVLRSDAACAFPRPSAIASAKFANSTVAHRKNVTRPANTFSFDVDVEKSRRNSTDV